MSLAPVRSSLQSAARLSDNAAGGFGRLQSVVSSGSDAAHGVEQAGRVAYQDTEETDSAYAGDQGLSSAERAESAVSSGKGGVSDILSLGAAARDSLREALSALSAVDGREVVALRSAIESALAQQGDANSGAATVEGALDKVEWCLDRAADDAGYVRNDIAGKSVSSYGYSMMTNGYDAGNAFSSAAHGASNGESSQVGLSRAISAALSLVDELEVELRDQTEAEQRRENERLLETKQKKSELERRQDTPRWHQSTPASSSFPGPRSAGAYSTGLLTAEAGWPNPSGWTTPHFPQLSVPSMPHQAMAHQGMMYLSQLSALYRSSLGASMPCHGPFCWPMLMPPNPWFG